LYTSSGTTCAEAVALHVIAAERSSEAGKFFVLIVKFAQEGNNFDSVINCVILRYHNFNVYAASGQELAAEARG
jgi:hypothetical protein